MLWEFLTRVESQIFILEKRTLAPGQSSSGAKHREGSGLETLRQAFLGLGQRLPCLWPGVLLSAWVSQLPTLLAGQRGWWQGLAHRAGSEEEPTSCLLPLRICVQRGVGQREQGQACPDEPESSGKVPSGEKVLPLQESGIYEEVTYLESEGVDRYLIFAQQ